MWSRGRRDKEGRSRLTTSLVVASDGGSCWVPWKLGAQEMNSCISNSCLKLIGILKIVLKHQKSISKSFLKLFPIFRRRAKRVLEGVYFRVEARCLSPRARGRRSLPRSIGRQMELQPELSCCCRRYVLLKATSSSPCRLINFWMPCIIDWPSSTGPCTYTNICYWDIEYCSCDGGRRHPGVETKDARDRPSVDRDIGRAKGYGETDYVKIRYKWALVSEFRKAFLPNYWR